MDCSPQGSSAHDILQARILEWIVMPSSRGSSQPRDWNHISLTSPALAGGFFTTSASWGRRWSITPFLSRTYDLICDKSQIQAFHRLRGFRRSVFPVLMLQIRKGSLKRLGECLRPHSSLQQSQGTGSVLSGAQARVAVLSWYDFAPQDIWRCLGTLLVVTAGEEDATGIYCAQGCCSTYYRAQHNPPNKELSGPNVWSSDTEKPTLWDSPGAHKALYFCLLHIVTYSWTSCLSHLWFQPNKVLGVE